MLNIKNTSLGYGQIVVVRDLSINVDQGESVCLIGPNGAGKSTILKSIMGQVKPKAGNIDFDGTDLGKLEVHKIANLGITLVPEGRGMITGLTVLENLHLAGNLKRAKAKKKENLEMVFQYFPVLSQRKNQAAGTLSGGEQQMLAIARALMTMPRLLLIDEPSIGLSPIAVAKAYEMVDKIRKAEKISVLLAEQNVVKALEVTERGYVLDHGRVVLQGTSSEIKSNESIEQSYLGV